MHLLSDMSEVEPGIFVREATQESTGAECQDYYHANALKILQKDRKHFYILARRFAPIFHTEFYNVAEIGGGHPKMSACMNVSEITVYDAFAPMYKKLHKEFLKWYPTRAKIEYKKTKITHPNFSPNAEVGVCAHVLEHMTLSQIRRLLGNVEVNKLIVYGPDLRKARGDRWIHYKPKDHVTFATLEAMVQLVTDAGFAVKVGEQHNEDYMIFAEK